MQGALQLLANSAMAILIENKVFNIILSMMMVVFNAQMKLENAPH